MIESDRTNNIAPIIINIPRKLSIPSGKFRPFKKAKIPQMNSGKAIKINGEI